MMSGFEYLERYDHAGCVIELHYDTEPMSPREWTQLGTIITWGRDSGWGDETLKYEPYDTDYSTIRWAVRIRREREATVVIPVQSSDYGSSGCQINICDWDNANAVILDTPRGREECWGAPQADLREVTALDREQIRESLGYEIQEMDTWARGEVYGFIVESADGETLESVWGFMGDDGLKEAKSEAESYAEDEERAHTQLAAYEMEH